MDAKTIHIAGQLDTGLRILYAGPMLSGSTTAQRAQALRDLGHRLTVIDTAAVREFVAKPDLLSRIQRKLLGPRDEVGANVSIIRDIRQQSFDILWIDKGLTVNPKTLNIVKGAQAGCRIVGFSPDDMMNRANQSRHFLRGLPLYDFFVSTKSYNVSELQGLGCPKVLFMENAYDPHTHRPMSVDANDRHNLGGEVGFIGQWEPERAESLRKLALAGIPVRVWGYTWERMKNVPSGLMLENRPLWGDDYARAICAFDINLCFLRKCNRDVQTTRTMEIPACGGFMLAEHSKEHERLFAGTKEAEFFMDDQELICKTRYYLDHPEERQLIAAKGLERCQRDGYSYKERLARVLDQIRLS